MGTEILKLRGVTEVLWRYYWEPRISQRETSQEWSERRTGWNSTISVQTSDFFAGSVHWKVLQAMACQQR